MPAVPEKYFTVTREPGNVVTGAHLPDAEPSGLEDGEIFVIQNISQVNDVYYEEREPDGAAGPGKVLRALRSITYEVNVDSPMFCWTKNSSPAELAIGPAIS